MTIRIAVVSPKGGVGKTTVALNLSMAFAERGRRTLTVDLDPQGGIAHALGKGDTGLVGLADLLMGRLEAAEAVLKTKMPKLAFLPRGRLSPIDVPDYEQALHTKGVLAGALEKIEAGFDLVVLDTPSGLGMPTRAALAVSDAVLLPLQAEPLALRSLTQAFQVIEHVKSKENPKLEFLGILPTMVDWANDPSMGVMTELWGRFAGVLETSIPRTAIFNAASNAGLPLGYLGGPVSPEARRFEMLAAELDGPLARMAGTEASSESRPQRQLL